MRRIPYFISESFKGIWRNGAMSIASILVLMACLIVMGSFSLLVYNIDYNLNQLDALNEIVVFVDEDYTDDQIEEVGNQIRALDNVDTDSLTRVTKAEALESMRQQYQGTDYEVLFTEMDDRGVNPFRDSYVITYEDSNQVSTLQYQLEQIDGIAKINCRSDLAQTIDNLKSGVIFIFGAFLIILFVVSVFVIINTIKLAVFSRHEEIEIMRYVGATKRFITMPFVFEGMFIGIISSVISYFIQHYLYSYIAKLVVKDYSIIKIVPFANVNLIIFAAFVAVGVLTGIIGSAISLAKYNKA